MGLGRFRRVHALGSFQVIPTASAGGACLVLGSRGCGTTTVGGGVDTGGLGIALAAVERVAPDSCLHPTKPTAAKAPRNTSNSPVLICPNTSAVRPALEPRVGIRTHFVPLCRALGTCYQAS